jgi:nucleotide-binding universal stress UspA family protein
MRPQQLATTSTDENTRFSQVLVAVDDSEHAARALSYVGTLLWDTRDAQVTLIHVLKPMPRGLLEHGGSENPGAEKRLARDLRKEQEDWIKSESLIEYPILAKALEVLEQTGFPLDRVRLKFGYVDDIAHSILEEARNGGYGTIVVTRHGSNGLKRFSAEGSRISYCATQTVSRSGWLNNNIVLLLALRVAMISGCTTPTVGTRATLHKIIGRLLPTIAMKQRSFDSLQKRCLCPCTGSDIRSGR